MSPTILRRLLVSSPAVALGLNACALHPFYHWYPDAKLPHCAAYVWKQMPRSSIPGVCSDNDGQAASEQASCTFGCLILSPFSEVEAEWVFDRDGMSIRDHEVKHTQGYKHWPNPNR